MPKGLPWEKARNSLCQAGRALALLLLQAQPLVGQRGALALMLGGCLLT